MPESGDIELLAEYQASDSEAAFRGLVERHVNLVYAVALRSTGNAHQAKEITQAVFLVLAKKAHGLSRRTVLSGWLYQTARLTAANFLRTERRRAQREQEAYLQSLMNEPQTDEAWQQIAPLLDEAMGRLGEKDRNAVVLRFFDGRSLGEVGAALGTNADAAKMRVNRALEKLRKFFMKRNVTLTTALIAGAVSANSVQAAPIGLALNVAAAAKTSAVAASTLAVAKGALKIMAWTKAKTATVAAATVLLTIGTTTVVVQKTFGEPSHGGKTVTEWLDQLVIYDYVRNAQGTRVVFRGAEAVTNNAALHALLKIGSRAVPVLVQRIQDRAEWPPEISQAVRAQRWLEWKWERLRGRKPTRIKGLENFPRFQVARKEAACFVLLALGTNGNGGFTRFMEAYAAAPTFESIYGTSLSGAPVGFISSSVVGDARSSLPHRREETFAEILLGLQHTNAACRTVALECIGRFFDEFPKWKARLVELTQDKDPNVQAQALSTLSHICMPWNLSALKFMPPAEIRQVAEAILSNSSSTERVREWAKVVLNSLDQMERNQ
jgi:RNA polymerase sigma factor (sigma-70 family)